MTDTENSAHMGHIAVTDYQPPPGAASPPAPKPPRYKGGAIAALIAAALFIGAISGAVAATLIDDPAPVVSAGPPVAEQAEPALQATLPATALDPAAVGATVIPSVVAVEVGSTRDGEFLKTASGSGVVFDNEHIVTNNHVIAGATAVQVVLSDGRVYPAEVVGSDAITDVAVLSVTAADLEPLALGSTDSLAVGMPAIAVGSPLGLEGGPSLSVGVISALGREVQTTPEVILYGMIQTDAPITNGSSGGALVDRNGALIGITTAVGASQLGIEGIGFATPIEIVEKIVNDILETGSASHALLGILGSTAYESIGNDGIAPIGVTVEDVTPNSAAQGAGIEKGQVITAADGAPVRTMDELITVLRLYRGGETVILDFANAESVTLQLGTR